MSDRRDELLEHVLENPSDEEARLVYADYLSSRGDPRGELINAQVRLSWRLNPARRRQFRRAEATLLGEHGDALLEATRALGMTATLRHGFVDEIDCPIETFVAHGAEIISREPVTRLILRGGGRGDLERIVADGLLRKIESLRLIEGRHDDRAVAALANSKARTSLRILNVSRAEVGDVGLLALAQSPNLALTALTSLSLNGNRVTGAGLAQFAEKLTVKGLRRLYLARNQIDASGVAALLTSPALAGLLHLGLTGNADIGDEGVRLFLTEAVAGQFLRVDLDQIEISSETRSEARALWGDRIKLNPY